MALQNLFRLSQQPAAGPVRPSDFNKTVEERVTPPELDYPTNVEGDVEVDTPDDYGWNPADVDRPVAVYVAAPIPADRPLTEWSGGTLPVGTIGSRIASDDRNRKRLIVRNLAEVAGETVYLTRQQSDQSFTGYALPPGADIIMEHCSSVWAHTDADTADVSFFVELTVEEYGN